MLSGEPWGTITAVAIHLICARPIITTGHTSTIINICENINLTCLKLYKFLSKNQNYLLMDFWVNAVFMMSIATFWLKKIEQRWLDNYQSIVMAMKENSEFDHFPHAVLNTVDTEVGLWMTHNLYSKQIPLHLPDSQCCPSNPTEHVQLYQLTKSLQIPPLKQVTLRQSSISKGKHDVIWLTKNQGDKWF